MLPLTPWFSPSAVASLKARFPFCANWLETCSSEMRRGEHGSFARITALPGSGWRRSMPCIVAASRPGTIAEYQRRLLGQTISSLEASEPSHSAAFWQERSLYCDGLRIAGLAVSCRFEPTRQRSDGCSIGGLLSAAKRMTPLGDGRVESSSFNFLEARATLTRNQRLTCSRIRTLA